MFRGEKNSNSLVMLVMGKGGKSSVLSVTHLKSQDRTIMPVKVTDKEDYERSPHCSHFPESNSIN